MGGKQLGFSDYELTTAKKQNKREKFLTEMSGRALAGTDRADCRVTPGNFPPRCSQNRT
jgi:hypothetical protein